MPPMNTLVVETILLPPERRTEINVKRSTKLLNQMLAAVDRHMAGREYLTSQFTAADIMTGHAVIMAGELGADLSDKPNLPSYIERAAQPSRPESGLVAMTTPLVLIIGCGDYIGAAIARRFAAGGFTVCMGRRNGDKLAPLTAEITNAGGRAYGYTPGCAQ